MKKLTRKQEKAVLRSVSVCDIIGDGTGRVCYYWNSAVVVKVAKNKNGKLQNEKEVERFAKYGDRNLARIYAYGRQIVIMEQVKPARVFKPNKISKWFCNAINEETTDCIAQGYRKGTKKLVLYDYGFTSKMINRALQERITMLEVVNTIVSDEMKKF